LRFTPCSAWHSISFLSYALHEGSPTVPEVVLAHLKAIGALKTGHFLLASGKHSALYIEKFDLLRRPKETETVCRGFATAFADQRVDVVVGPTTGGIILAFEVARQLDVLAAYAERSAGNSTRREFRRGTTFERGQRVLVIDDILTSGGSIRETLTALDDQPVDVIGIGVLLDRSAGAVQFGDIRLFSLAELEVEAWTADECPLCQRGIPLVKPGTTKAQS
jgi:orotate phosphoribosyltransferase